LAVYGIQRARDARVIDPIPWITKGLKSNLANKGKYSYVKNEPSRGNVVEAAEQLQHAFAAGMELPPRPF
jgi:hypothetical protein